MFTGAPSPASNRSKNRLSSGNERRAIRSSRYASPPPSRIGKNSFLPRSRSIHPLGADSAFRLICVRVRQTLAADSIIHRQRSLFPSNAERLKINPERDRFNGGTHHVPRPLRRPASPSISTSISSPSACPQRVTDTSREE